MSTEAAQPSGPDFTEGVTSDQVPEGRSLSGHVGDDAVLLARSGGRCFAIRATCSHYGGPLAEGIIVDGTVRCPWHHAAFHLDAAGAANTRVTGSASRPSLSARSADRGQLDGYHTPALGCGGYHAGSANAGCTFLHTGDSPVAIAWR